ncbi:MAG TPA: hypothetical protein ENJ57_05365 [Rhizobiales bacterium]|nr:hypothetical protein [Hyphomicrobiales bacterium]
MRVFTIVLKSLAGLGVLAMLSACAQVDDGYPRISEIKTPHPGFLSPYRQRVEKSRLARAKADHVYRKKVQIRSRSRDLKPEKKN